MAVAAWSATALHCVSRDDLQWTHLANVFHKSATWKPQIQCRIRMNPQNNRATIPCRKHRASFVQQRCVTSNGLDRSGVLTSYKINNVSMIQRFTKDLDLSSSHFPFWVLTRSSKTALSKPASRNINYVFQEDMPEGNKLSKYALLRCCSPSSVHQQVHGNHFETRSYAKKFWSSLNYTCLRIRQDRVYFWFSRHVPGETHCRTNVQRKPTK